jgi:hypothetical protein
MLSEPELWNFTPDFQMVSCLACRQGFSDRFWARVPARFHPRHSRASGNPVRWTRAFTGVTGRGVGTCPPPRLGCGQWPPNESFLALSYIEPQPSLPGSSTAMCAGIHRLLRAVHYLLPSAYCLLFSQNGHFQLRISGMSSPTRAMYCLCSISLMRRRCLASAAPFFRRGTRSITSPAK